MGTLPKELTLAKNKLSRKSIQLKPARPRLNHRQAEQNSNPQMTDKPSCDGEDDGPTGNEGNFLDDIARDKMTLLPNAGSDDSAPRKSPLTIKPQLEIGLSSKQLLTVADLASMLGISRPTIYRLVEGRQIPFLKLGSLIRFTKANVEQFLNQRQINPIQ